MKIILLEKIRNFGGIGDIVEVRSGFARNFLIPYSKAVTANNTNIEKFKKMRDELEKNAIVAIQLAEIRREKFKNVIIIIPVRAMEDGRVFGSVNVSTIFHAIKKAGFEVSKSEISIPNGPIRQVGEYDITLLLHSDVIGKIKVNIIHDTSCK